MKCKLCEALQIKEKGHRPLQRGEAAGGLAPIVLPFGFTQSIKLCQIPVGGGGGEGADWVRGKEWSPPRGEGGCRRSSHSRTQEREGGREWPGSDVHGEVFSCIKMCWGWETGLAQRLASLERALTPDPFKLEAALCSTFLFSAPAFLLSLSLRVTRSLSSIGTKLLFYLASKDAMRSPPLPCPAPP